MRWSYRLAALHSIAAGSALAEDARYITKPMNLKCATGLAFQVATKCETHRGHGGPDDGERGRDDRVVIMGGNSSKVEAAIAFSTVLKTSRLDPPSKMQ